MSFQLAAEPGKTLAGTVSKVAERVETDDAGESYLLVTVDLPDELPVQRVPGATAVARITCSRGSLGEAWFYELVDAVKLWMPF